MDRCWLSIDWRRRLRTDGTVISPSNPTGVMQNYTSVMTFLQPEICQIVEPGIANGTRISD